MLFTNLLLNVITLLFLSFWCVSFIYSFQRQSESVFAVLEGMENTTHKRIKVDQHECNANSNTIDINTSGNPKDNDVYSNVNVVNKPVV